MKTIKIEDVTVCWNTNTNKCELHIPTGMTGFQLNLFKLRHSKELLIFKAENNGTKTTINTNQG